MDIDKAFHDKKTADIIRQFVSDIASGKLKDRAYYLRKSSEEHFAQVSYSIEAAALLWLYYNNFDVTKEQLQAVIELFPERTGKPFRMSRNDLMIRKQE